jgi:sigma-B regulation protein RsbU (phosphoserine phosphatase)
MTHDILIIVILVFTLSLGFLYWQSRNIIREEAIDEASHVLDNTALRVKRIYGRDRNGHT